jgi:riboflavin kinase / FMN adenylyltransferase
VDPAGLSAGDASAYAALRRHPRTIEPRLTDPPVRVARSLGEIPAADSVVTIGVFDGVHRGHRTLIGRARRHAEEHDLRSVVVTFDRHPMEVVRPGSQPRYLQSLDRKVTSLLAEGIDLVYVVTFDFEFSQQSADQFIQHTLAGPIHARRVIVGANFRFGHGAEGDVALLADRGEDLGFEVEAVTILEVEGTAISSSEVRDRIARGEVEWAREALGRPHMLEGVVSRGDARGATIGFPTANVEVDDRMQMPANGVYAGHAVVLGGDGTVHPMVVNIGTRPTFGGEHVTVEAHLLDTTMDLYGVRLGLSLEHRLRDERRFAGVDELVAQISDDVTRARDLLGV